MTRGRPPFLGDKSTLFGLWSWMRADTLADSEDIDA